MITILIFVGASVPSVTKAQSQGEAEYRAHLIQIIELLQQQIILLQAERTQVQGVLGVPDLEDFESFLVGDKEDVVAWYTISNPELATILPDMTHGRYFSRFFDIVPDDYDEYFIDLLVFDKSRIEFDGFVETVPPYRADTWRFGVNEEIFELALESEIINELFVHEFSHIISYEEIAHRPKKNHSSCHAFFDEFGCPPANSYLLDFIDEFWSEDDLDTLLKTGDPERVWTSQEIRNDFVTDYAATHPAEDFAESFTFFVFEERVEEDTLSIEKTNYFYQFPALVELRKEIRNNL